MTRKIEVGLGDIRVQCDDRHIYIVRAIDGTPGKILLSYDLNESDGTCKQNILPAFYEIAPPEPFKVVISGDHGDKRTYTKDMMLAVADNLDTTEYLKRYFKKLVIEDFDCLNECYGDETRTIYYDSDIAQVLQEEYSPEE